MAIQIKFGTTEVIMRIGRVLGVTFFFIPRSRPTSRISGFSYYFLVLVPQNLSQELFLQ